jgi:hypothetical protein
MNIICKAVFRALDNALENGYDPREDTAEQNAHELSCYDADLEEITEEELLPYVCLWLENNRG